MFNFDFPPVLTRRRRSEVALRFEVFEERTVPAVAIGANFPGVFADTVPPFGNSGAVGPNHYVEFLSGGFIAFDKTGVLIGDLIPDTVFWNQAGIATTDTQFGVLEPRIIYDPLSNRWFAMEITLHETANKVLVGRSDTPDPTGTWKATSYVANAGFADIPTLALDANGVYIGTENFTDIFTPDFISNTLTSIPKADLLLATPSVANRTTREQAGHDMGFSIQGVTNFNPNPTHASIIGVDFFEFGVIDRTTITGTGGANAQFGPTTAFGVQQTSFPDLSRQPDGTRVIYGGDDRFSGNIYQVGDLIYMAQTISVDANGNAVDSGPTTTNATRVTVFSDSLDLVVAQGTYFSPDFDYIFPSISANQYGDMLIGFSRSGPNQGTGPTDGNLGAYAVYARINPANPTTITFGSEIQLQAGLVNNYAQDGGGFEIWGIYSSTTVDPTNPLAFWTTQEFAGTQTAWFSQISQVFVSPRASSISSSTPNGTYGLGEVIPLTISFNQALTVTGAPQLQLNSGGTAVYATGSGTSTLTFNYTVGTGQSTPDLDVTAAAIIDLNGGTITDAISGLDAELNVPAPGTLGSLGANKNLAIDTRAKVNNVTAPVTDGRYGAGSIIPVEITFDQPVVVTGAPQVALNSGGIATYSSGSGTDTLTFTYTVAVGESAADLDYSSTTALGLNGGTITDQATGQDATLTLPAPGGLGSIGDDQNIIIDTTAPQVTGVDSPTPDGSYGFNDVIEITVEFHKPVAVTGTPQLALNSGGTASYSSGDGTTTLTFTYTVGAGHVATDLDYTSTGALTLNGGSIVEVGSGLAADLTLPAPGAAGSLSANTNIAVSAIQANVTNVTSPVANATYPLGAVIDITIQFNRPLEVTGTPTLALNTGGIANYVSGSGTNTLTFRYTVGAGQNTADLDYAGTNAISLNGGTIQESSGLAADLTLPAPGAVGSLGANKNIAIDTIGPVVQQFRVLFGSKWYDLIGSTRTVLPWQIKGIQVVFSEAVNTGNVRSLTGITATKFLGLRTKILTWNFPVKAKGSFQLDLASTGADALKDAAGNPIPAFGQLVNVLYGDFTGDGVVNAADEAGVRAHVAGPFQLNGGNYNIFADLSGDGIVNLVDVGIARARKGTSLPV